MDLVKKIIIVSIVFLVLIGQQGCYPKITFQGGFLEYKNHELGTIGIVSVNDIPKTRLELPPKGMLAGAERGMKVGTSQAISQVLIEGPVQAVGNGKNFASLLILGAASVAVGSTIGLIYGAFNSEPVEKIEQTEHSLQQALSNLKIFQKLREHILVQAQTKSPYSIIDATQSPDKVKKPFSDLANSENPRIDTLLIIEGITLGLEESGYSMDSQITVFLETRIILLQPGNNEPMNFNKLIYFNIFNFETKPRPYTEWAENDAQLFIEALQTASQKIANQICKEILI